MGVSSEKSTLPTPEKHSISKTDKRKKKTHFKNSSTLVDLQSNATRHTLQSPIHPIKLEEDSKMDSVLDYIPPGNNNHNFFFLIFESGRRVLIHMSTVHHLQDPPHGPLKAKTARFGHVVLDQFVCLLRCGYIMINRSLFHYSFSNRSGHFLSGKGTRRPRLSKKHI